MTIWETIGKLIQFIFLLRDKYLPDQIIGDFDSIRPEVFKYYKDKNVKQLQRLDTDTTDLEKCLYVSLEKISTLDTDCEDLKKKYSIIFFGASGGRIDHTFSVFSQVFKYILMFPDVREKAELIMLSKSSCSVYLRPGFNKIITSNFFENKEQGYSIIPINGEASIEIIEEGCEDFCAKKEVKFGECLFFRKKNKANIIYVTVNCEINTALLYSFTTSFS